MAKRGSGENESRERRGTAPSKKPAFSRGFRRKNRDPYGYAVIEKRQMSRRVSADTCVHVREVTGERRTWWLHAGLFRTSALFTRCPPTKIWNVMSLRRLRMERRGTVSGGRGRIARPECRGRKRRENRGTRRQGPGRTTRDEPCHPNAPPTRPRRPCLTARTARDRRRTDERRSRALSSGSASRRRFVHCC